MQKLLNAREMLDEVFSAKSRPSIRWVRVQTKRKAIPYIRIGHRVFFDADMMRKHIAEKNSIKSRG